MTSTDPAATAATDFTDLSEEAIESIALYGDDTMRAELAASPQLTYAAAVALIDLRRPELTDAVVGNPLCPRRALSYAQKNGGARKALAGRYARAKAAANV